MNPWIPRIWTLVALLLGFAGGAATGYTLNLRYGPKVHGMPELPMGLSQLLAKEDEAEELEPLEPKVSVTRLTYLAAKPDPGPPPATGPYIPSVPSETPVEATEVMIPASPAPAPVSSL